ncbi:MAG: hypothetical protein LIR22_06025 [Bacillota bacterium]|nr:hypothetical protein [Bacillota bacterium]
MTKYIKTTATEFEQFDEAEWDRKYKSCQHPEDWQQLAGRLNIDRHMGQFIIQSREGDMRLHDGDWIATGVNGEHWPIADDVFKKTYAELPVIPVEIANAIEEYRDRFGSAKGLNELITDMNVPWKLGVLETVTAIPEIILGVFRSKTDVLARAWLDGYEIDNKS